MLIRSKPSHQAPWVDSVLLVRILAVDRSAVGVPMSSLTEILLPPLVMQIRWGSGFCGGGSKISVN